eukprot:scpid112173/ scgid25968/ 
MSNGLTDDDGGKECEISSLSTVYYWSSFPKPHGRQDRPITTSAVDSTPYGPWCATHSHPCQSIYRKSARQCNGTGMYSVTTLFTASASLSLKLKKNTVHHPCF